MPAAMAMGVRDVGGSPHPRKGRPVYRLGRRSGRPGNGEGDWWTASDALEQADEVAGELGAEPLRQQIASLARRGRLGLGVAHRDDDLVSDLTPRETDVVELLVEGHTNRQIGEALYITEKTVERHVTSILSKLQVDNRTEAAAVVRRRELLDTRSRP